MIMTKASSIRNLKRTVADPRRPSKPIAIVVREIYDDRNGGAHVAVSLPALAFIDAAPVPEPVGRIGYARHAQALREADDALRWAVERAARCRARRKA